MSAEAVDQETRPQFGNRFLLDKKNVFEHNAWDNVVWDEVQEAEAKSKVEENSEIVLTSEEIEKLDQEAAAHWDAFYDIHQNRFFKDRHWLFTEFPELAQSFPPSGKNADVCAQSSPPSGKNTDGSPSGISDSHLILNDNKSDSGEKVISEATVVRTNVSESDEPCAATGSESNDDLSDIKGVPSEDSSPESFPGESSKFRVLEVGCGVGNTIFPILKTNNSKDLFVYGCDFSSHAIDIVKASPDYEQKRCFAFVCDLTSEEWTAPFPKGTLDCIVCIFVLSAVHPDKFGQIINNMASYLRPGGLILFRDYGRYDLAQLRFKKGRCVADNFYVRGDGTRCYFFTQEEIRQLMQSAGLEEGQNLVDRRLQVNRGKRVTMYRVWVQAKYKKPMVDNAE